MKGKLLVGVTFVALVVAGLATYSWAASGEGQTINACANAGGVMSLANAAGDCKAGSTPLSWNTVGPQGATGPQGPAGAQGPAGSAAGDPDAAAGTVAVTGQKQGSFGNSPMVLIGMSHEIVSPRDAASGQATGKRQHKPFTIVKEWDKATPLLLNALTTNENLTSVLIGLSKPNGQQFATIKLTNAHLTDYQANGLTEHWSFVYQKITWTYVDGGITAEDDWEAPVAR
jgi:type VI secretion system secreted protein Hcp